MAALPCEGRSLPPMKDGNHLQIQGDPNWKDHAPGFMIRSLAEVQEAGLEKVADTNTWLSRRYLVGADSFGFSFHHTVLKAGKSTYIHYKNHVEAVLVVEGEGTIELVREGQKEGEGFAKFRLGPGVFYGLGGGQESHFLRASEASDLSVACAFNPPVTGVEDHNKEGVYPVIARDGTKLYSYGEDMVRELFQPPDAFKFGSMGTSGRACPTLPCTLQTLKDSLPVHLRKAVGEDGPALWRLAQTAGLDVNSPYCYNLFCMSFCETVVVAEQQLVPGRAPEVVGYVMGFRPPGRLGTYFVW
ncbi:unnamed protein product, partial [Polarella glacialis]